MRPRLIRYNHQINTINTMKNKKIFWIVIVLAVLAVIIILTSGNQNSGNRDQVPVGGQELDTLQNNLDAAVSDLSTSDSLPPEDLDFDLGL